VNIKEYRYPKYAKYSQGKEKSELCTTGTEDSQGKEKSELLYNWHRG
jgi:hypothetical protein